MTAYGLLHDSLDGILVSAEGFHVRTERTCIIGISKISGCIHAILYA
jgi:hypothetical protein